LKQQQTRKPAGRKLVKQLPQRNRGQGKTTTGMSTLRTVDTISRRLITGMNNMQIGPKARHPYLACRANPFAGHGGRGIPDGNNDNFVVTDLYAADTIALGAGANTFSIQTLPSLPVSSFLGTSDPVSVNGVTYAANSIATVSSFPLQENQVFRAFVPLGTPAQWPLKNIGSAGATIPSDPYNSNKARFVAFAYRLTYTGPAYNCAGSITITPNSACFQDIGNTLSSSAASATIVAVSTENTAGARTQLPLGTPMLSLDYSLEPNQISRESLTIRPEQGLLLIPKHATSDFKIRPIYDSPQGLLQNDSLQNTGATVSNNKLCIMKTTTLTSGGVVMYDNDWSGFVLNFTGLNSDASFRWETVYCVEYSPNAISAFKGLTKRSEPAAPQVIKEAQTQAATTTGIQTAREDPRK